MRRFFLVIPVHNRVEETVKCLGSILAQRDYVASIVIVDDGSTDGTQETIRARFGADLPITFIAGDGTLWWAGAVEKAALACLPAAATGDYLVTLNNDVVLPEDAFKIASVLLDKYPECMLGAISVDSADSRTIVHTGWRMSCWPLALTERIWWPGLIDEETEAEDNQIAEVDFLPGTMTFTPVSAIKAYGTVNARKLPHYHADSEYSYRLKRSGMRVLLSRELYVYHNVQTTGVAGDLSAKLSFLDICRSFFSIRSGNCLKYKWRYAVLCAPPAARIPFFVCDTIKVLVRSFGGLLFGDSIEGLLKLRLRRGRKCNYSQNQNRSSRSACPRR